MGARWSREHGSLPPSQRIHPPRLQLGRPAMVAYWIARKLGLLWPFTFASMMHARRVLLLNGPSRGVRGEIRGLLGISLKNILGYLRDRKSVV